MDIVITAIVAIIAALVAPFVYELLRPRIQRPKLGRSLKFDADRQVLVVYPPRDNPDPDQDPILPMISVEDFMGINHLQRIMASAGLPQDKVLLTDCDLWDKDPNNAQQNLVLLCAPWRNRATNKALEGLNALLTEVKISFEETPEAPPTGVRQMPFGQADVSGEKKPRVVRQIRFQGGVFTSPTREQIPALKKQDKPVEEGPLDDYALILNVPAGAWSSHGPVLVVAGLRGIGTWGACDHLRRNIKKLGRRTGRNGFAMLVRVRYEKWVISETEEINLVTFK